MNMNRFRGRKKGKDELDAPRPSVESESSSPFKMFGKKKAPEEEPKKEIDLASALPSTDEFRTSLLMTNLSARFSMLREQDDPNTKVGKASDDSVLFPKRQSRMMDFGFSAGLGDIAEVESIRAPFARSSFQSSDDAASTSGSMMGRSKPTEGNNLFGGRQKIYKIAAGGSGAMSGRALYDDDVAQSAFQKWRQAEKERRQSLEDLDQNDSVESETARPESPAQPDYNRKRETNSTTSSGPRNSTAATSVNSSQPASVKDWQSFAGTSRTVSPTPPMERSVTRTRRLYEQSLNQDVQDQQSSALSRLDTLSRRTLGNRTPDLTPTLPSPASATFGDRFVNRSILAKASAPNLRSFSPPTSSQLGPVDSANKYPSVEEKAFGATPPLSPPISETGEAQPLDRSKLLNGRSSGQYDENRYAQRQVQMQQGRDTPTNRFRAESNASQPVSVSRSSSTNRTFEKHDSSLFKTEPTVQEETQPSTFFDDDDDDQPLPSEVPPPQNPPPPPPQVHVERPADHEHPAFRKSALPTPLSLSDRPESIASRAKDESPEDSPTLGPASGGLSGMVRQHLRNDSTASSVYGSLPNDADLASRFPPERPDAHAYEPMTVNANAWETIERDLAMSIDGSVTSPTRSSGLVEAQILSAPNSARNSKLENDQGDEPDEFARHLADGARRVRERLTSYVEADSSKLVPAAPPVSELPPPPRPNALGILKSKSSRGSLVDRGRMDRETQSQSKAKKLLGLRGSSPAPASASPRRSSFEFSDEAQRSPEDRDDRDGQQGPEEKENMHAGLKAFRQARRELQRMKELEVQQRYQAPQKAPPSRDRAQTAGSRPPSQERRPPPVTYNRVPSEEVRNGSNSRSASRAPSERDRSGSEASSGGRSGSRPPRLRNGSIPRDDHHNPLASPMGPNGMPRQGPMLRSQMMPGQDMRRSPHVPPQSFAVGNASPGRFNRPDNNLHIQPGHGYDAGQPSPITPLSGAPSPYGPPGAGPRGPYGGPYPGGVMRNRDMSEPSIMSPTSQMGPRDALRPGPGGLNGGAASTPNLHGNMTAPPLPPINPRRKNTGTTLGDGTMGSHHPLSAAGGDEHRAGFRSEDDDSAGLYRQRLRKATSEANGMNVRARSMRQSPPHPMAPPPLPPSMSSNVLPGGMI
ncbi:hypothetical protein NW767_005888 [Fusarium falciforme]|uniref:Uncharacterized protein n=1 Tax=Fusarium falciforme TaxID=195108 RepID=A0A9W8R7I7_9HYPO|nr:hypothetical protein NW755_005402 [Fusarium falciforme]KAJ4202519.1 hypothetical protein NW767_005888 [Fusarium falciforme]KAJ4253593.1 hypothetical protein NW757_005545 [Fusarium falciforme]